MMKFAFETVKGDDVRVLAVYNSKSEAMEHAEEIKKSFTEYEGFLTLISADLTKTATTSTTSIGFIRGGTGTDTNMLKQLPHCEINFLNIVLKSQ